MEFRNELDDPDFMKDLRIILAKMSEVALIIGEYQWPAGVRSQRVSEIRGL